MKQLPYKESLSYLGKYVFDYPESQIWSQMSAFIGDSSAQNEKDVLDNILSSAGEQGFTHYMCCPTQGKHVKVFVY